MPTRKTPLISHQYYHVFNRSFDHRPLYSDKREFSRMMIAINYYRFVRPPIKLSRFLSFSQSEKERMVKELNKSPRRVTILGFVLMPNHFHFLLQQRIDGGISRFIKDIANSYTRYFNTKHERVGPMYEGQFKAVLIESDEQLLHVSRYIHLNPYSSFVVKSFRELIGYPWSSLTQYLHQSKGFCTIKTIMNFFKSTDAYMKFLEDQADYQRSLEEIKHLLLE